MLNECFSFVTKAFVNYEKLIRFNQQAFIVYNRVNLKTLIEIFCQELVVFNVILAFLDHLKLKIFFKHGDRYIAPHFRLLFKISGSAPAHNLLPLSFQHKVFYSILVHFLCTFQWYMIIYTSSHQETFLEKDVLKICSKFTGEHLCQSVVSTKLFY